MNTPRVFFLLFVASILSLILLLSNIHLTKSATAKPQYPIPNIHSLLTTLYVDAATGDDGDDCLTPATACLTVGGAVGKAASDDTIQIASGTYIEHLDINFNLNFIGAGMENTFLDGGQTGRVFIAASSQISLSNLTIQNGDSGSENGGGIFNYGGLVLDQVRVRNNSSNNWGGGIVNSGDLILQNSEVISNTADSVGGGIYVWSNAALTVTNSLIGWNNAMLGGGIFTLDMLNLENTTVRNNVASSYGAGIFISGGSATLSNSTIYQNQADQYGAGIFNEIGTLTLTNSTISGNISDNHTGLGNFGAGAQATILNSTIAHNVVTSSGTRYGGVSNIGRTMSLKNTIVANNGNRQCSSSGNWTSLGYNLSSDGFCNFTQTGDQQNTDPDLAPLAEYGGATWTHALLPGSPAIDSGTNAGCPATDQRGVPRPFDGDNDGTPTCDKGAFEAQNSITISDVTLLEGDAGTVNAVFTVTLSPTSTQLVTLAYATTDGTAISGNDYQPISGTLTFNPGETTQLVSVPVIGDTDDEPNENFFVNLSNAVNADILDSQGTATIVDDDGLPSLTIADGSVDEGNSGTTNAIFTVTLSPSNPQEVTVDFDTVNGTALAGSDYATTNGTLTFDPGETTQLITVTVSGDIVDEGLSESFFVNLSNPFNANFTDDAAAGTITDDDTASISLGTSQSANEGDGGTTILTFEVTLSVPTSFTVTVDYTTQSGIGGTYATPGVDYTETSGTLTFAPGETIQTFTVTILGDTESEVNEYFTLYISNADPINISGSVSFGYILNDDDWRVFLPVIVR